MRAHCPHRRRRPIARESLCVLHCVACCSVLHCFVACCTALHAVRCCIALWCVAVLRLLQVDPELENLYKFVVRGNSTVHLRLCFSPHKIGCGPNREHRKQKHSSQVKSVR